MKNPPRYQLSEYDCGPTSMLNALAFLFEREDIPPEAVRNIMLYCLDCYGSDGVSGKSGTSCAAMMFLSNWLNGFGKIGRLHISTQIRTACRWCTTTRANTTGSCRAPASSVRPTRFTRLARLTPAKPFSCLMTGRA